MEKMLDKSFAVMQNKQLFLTSTLSLSHTHTPTHTDTLTHPQTHTHTHTLSVFLVLSLPNLWTSHDILDLTYLSYS